MEKGDRPPKVRLKAGSLEEADFDTPAQRATAEAILRYYEDYHDFAGISRESGWSEPQVRRVFYEYFEEAEEGDKGLTSDLPDDPLMAYREGYRDGYRDAREDFGGSESID